MQKERPGIMFYIEDLNALDKVDDAEFSAKGNGGLGHITGQHLQSAALAAGQQHGDTLFFHDFFSSFACSF